MVTLLRSRAQWVKLFRKTFKFTGGEIVGEFLMSTGYLPGAHHEACFGLPAVPDGAEHLDRPA